MKENKRLKQSLLIQSFAPLFVILLLKHMDACEYIRLIRKFFGVCFTQNLVAAFVKAIHSAVFGEVIVSTIGVVWILLTIVVAFQYNKIQKSGFSSHGESIIIGDAPNDGGATFLVTYVLPLLTDDVTTIRGLILFLVMLWFVIRLLSHSNTFYQNPILAAMDYKSFAFQFRNPNNDIMGGTAKTFIGITRGKGVSEEAVIKRKYIADGVFMIYNE